MIGVLTGERHRTIVEEFFELFKTPWEPAVAGRKYRVVLSDNYEPQIDEFEADLYLLYGTTEHQIDERTGVKLRRVKGPLNAEWSGVTFPIYGCATLFDCQNGALRVGPSMLDFRSASEKQVWRVGYDLFKEIEHLLVVGQPAAQASQPTLECHIALLRHFLVESGVGFLEVLPRPASSDFICCLTHDIDFFGIRRHAFDRTLGGFVARATLGSTVDLFRGRRTLSEVMSNYLAVAQLPLVHLGLKPDFWQPLADYAKADGGRPSTFFVVPCKGRPGVGPDGMSNPARAVKYQISEVSDELKQAAAPGVELAVHGVDAWCDDEAGRAELKELTAVTGAETAGVRMHWLYFANESPERLDAAGFDYDSSCGYNETIGYKAGTAQVFRPIGSRRLLELPLSIMDSALLSKGRLGLAWTEALARCRSLVSNARRFGGTLVVNWHDRSLAPERLWNRCYEGLLGEIGKAGVWFATAGQAVAWFRWRRSIRFEVAADTGTVIVRASARPSSIPGARVAVHSPGQRRGNADELVFHGSAPLTITLMSSESRSPAVSCWGA